MNRRQNSPPFRLKDPAYRPAFERLDAALEQKTPSDNSEKIELLGRHMFGDLWHEQKPAGTAGLTK